MTGVRVRSEEAERTKNKLISLGVLDKTRRAKRDEGYVIFPVTEEVEGFENITTTFEEQKRKKFKDYLEEFLAPSEVEHVHRSFDVIGDIAVIEIPGELEDREAEIAESLIAAHKNINTVFKKSGEVKGEERLRQLKFLAGEGKTETLHREHGCRFKVDVAKVYFSPRISYERQRILEQTKDGEVVVDLFAGVGPFSIILAKYRSIKAYAIDINPAAYEYLKKNIKLNKVEDKVVPMFGDCRKIAPHNIATRVIMNLPKSADEFLDLAFDVVESGVIHFYSISSEEDLYDSKIEFIKKIAGEKDRRIRIVNKRIVRPYAPRRHHIVIDVEVH